MLRTTRSQTWAQGLLGSAGGGTSHPGTICGFNLGSPSPGSSIPRMAITPGGVLSQVRRAPPLGSQGHPSPAGRTPASCHLPVLSGAPRPGVCSPPPRLPAGGPGHYPCASLFSSCWGHPRPPRASVTGGEVPRGECLTHREAVATGLTAVRLSSPKDVLCWVLFGPLLGWGWRKG